MNIVTIEVNDKKYNVAQASAAEQKRLLSLIGARLSLTSATSGAEKIDIDHLFGSLLALPEDQFDQVAGIVLYKAFIQGADEKICIDDFQNRVTDYYRLVAAAVKENLADFLSYLDSVNSEARKLAEKSHP